MHDCSNLHSITTKCRFNNFQEDDSLAMFYINDGETVIFEQICDRADKDC